MNKKLMFKYSNRAVSCSYCRIYIQLRCMTFEWVGLLEYFSLSALGHFQPSSLKENARGLLDNIYCFIVAMTKPTWNEFNISLFVVERVQGYSNLVDMVLCGSSKILGATGGVGVDTVKDDDNVTQLDACPQLIMVAGMHTYSFIHHNHNYKYNHC